MTIQHRVKFYPVGNGDSSQVILSNGRRVLMDFRHQKSGESADSANIDLSKTLKDELKSASRDSFDVVAFTHADSDHICGSVDFFELRHAEKYQGNGRVKIDELWVPAAMLIESAENSQQSDEFVILRQEARYRLLEGKGIKVFSKPSVLEKWLTEALEKREEPAHARDHLFVDAGTIVPGFALDKDGVEFFCHSPFIKHCDEGDVVRNEGALIFNIRFSTGQEQFDYLAIGDTEWNVLEDIYDITSYHNNLDRLRWDLFNIPHHCSYLALSDEKGEKETTPKPKVKEILKLGKQNAYMISSSHPIHNDEDAYNRSLPPHIQAKKTYEHYLEVVNGRKLLVTMSEPNEESPRVIEFELTDSGMSKKQERAIGSAALITSVPPRAGCC